MKIVVITALAFSLASPVLAEDVLPAPARDAQGVYQVIRGTDNQLNCSQLISEMNLLNSQIKDQAAKSAPKGTGQGATVAKGAAVGMASGLAQTALARIPFGGGFGALAGRMGAA